MVFMPAVVQAVPGDDFTVFAYCNDGAVRLVDVRGGVFSPLVDQNFFRDRLTILNDTVAWDITGDRNPTACVDLDAEQIFLESPIVADPLEDKRAG